MQTARLYDLKNLCHAGEIPLAKLAPGHVLAEVRGVAGRVWVRQEDLEDLRRRQGVPAIKHPPLDGATRERVRWLAGVLAEFEPLSAEAWEDRLRGEIDLDRELTRWGHIAGAYAHFAPPGKTMPAAARRDYYGLCVACFVNGPDAALATMPLTRLSRARARRVVDHIRRTHNWA